MKRIAIHPVSRIEGHATVTIQLGEDGSVERTELNITQVRGFERFTQGRPFYEMPGITSRICGICPISHQLASAKACEAIMAVHLSPTARKLRELIHCAQFVQSHALSFFYLSAPDFLLGMDSDPGTRNIMGIIASHPEIARDGIELRKFGLQIIEGLAKERVHPAWIVPGGVTAHMSLQLRDRILAELPGARAIATRALDSFLNLIDKFPEELEHFGSTPTMYVGLVDHAGLLDLYEGGLRFRRADGEVLHDHVPPEDYQSFIAEATLSNSYLKAPYFRPLGLPEGAYRVGPLARLNVADGFGTPEADLALQHFRERFGFPAHSAFLYHCARLIEIVYALDRIEILAADAELLDDHVLATAGVNASEGIGVIEAPRGILIHHYKVNDDGAIVWANLIVATGHNNLAMGKAVQEVSQHFISGDKLQEGMLNRVSAVLRAYDPCFSCSTHAQGKSGVHIRLLERNGGILDEIA